MVLGIRFFFGTAKIRTRVRLGRMVSFFLTPLTARPPWSQCLPLLRYYLLCLWYLARKTKLQKKSENLTWKSISKRTSSNNLIFVHINKVKKVGRVPNWMSWASSIILKDIYNFYLVWEGCGGSWNRNELNLVFPLFCSLQTNFERLVRL